MQIEVNKKISAPSLSSSFIKKVLKRGLTLLKKNVSISVALVDEKTIRFLNRKYRKKNKPTDVLAFPDFVQEPKGRFLSPRATFLGEIIICSSIIKKQAKFYQESEKTALARVLVHGLLHLLGYDHKKRKAKMVMEKKTAWLMGKIFNL